MTASPGNESRQRFFVEFEADEACPATFTGDPEIILFFVSWAFSVRYGADHELAEIAKRLDHTHKISLRPLLRYADRDASDDADRRELERVWQDAAPLAECCRQVAAALDTGDERLDELLDGYETLAPRLLELATMCDWAAERSTRVRLTFDMSPDQPAASHPAPHEHGAPPGSPSGGPEKGSSRNSGLR